MGTGSTRRRVDRCRLAGEPTPVDAGWSPRVVEQLPDIDDPPWHAHPAIQPGLWAAFVGVFSATCVSPLGRRLLRRSRDATRLDPAVRRARRLAVVVSAAYLTVAAGLVAVLAQFGTGAPLPWLWTALRVLALSSVAMTVGLVAMTTRAWSKQWPPQARPRHVTVTTAAAVFVPFLAYWHLLVWRPA